MCIFHTKSRWEFLGRWIEDESEREQPAVGGGWLGTFVRNRLKPGLQYEEPELDGLKPELRTGRLTQGTKPLEI